MTKHPKRRPRDPNMARAARDHQIPNFSVSCNKREDNADFYASAIGQGHGGSGSGDGSMKSDSITLGAIQSRLVKYIGRLLQDTRPSSSSL